MSVVVEYTTVVCSILDSMNDTALIMFHDFTVTVWFKVFNLTNSEIVMCFNLLWNICLFSVKALFNCNSCLYIQRRKIFARKELWNLSISFQFCSNKFKIVNVFIRYYCNLILHIVKLAGTGSGRTKIIFTRSRFGSSWLHSLQFLLLYHWTSPVSPSPTHFGMACYS